MWHDMNLYAFRIDSNFKVDLLLNHFSPLRAKSLNLVLQRGLLISPDTQTPLIRKVHGIVAFTSFPLQTLFRCWNFFCSLSKYFIIFLSHLISKSLKKLELAFLQSYFSLKGLSTNEFNSTRSLSCLGEFET